MLDTSSISKSWSGTPGSFFRSIMTQRGGGPSLAASASSQDRHADSLTHMEFDFTKNKSCDSISPDKEKKSR